MLTCLHYCQENENCALRKAENFYWDISLECSWSNSFAVCNNKSFSCPVLRFLSIACKRNIYRSVATFCNKIAFYGFQSFVTSFLFTSQNDIIDIFVTKLYIHCNIYVSHVTCDNITSEPCRYITYCTLNIILLSNITALIPNFC